MAPETQNDFDNFYIEDTYDDIMEENPIVLEPYGGFPMRSLRRNKYGMSSCSVECDLFYETEIVSSL